MSEQQDNECLKSPWVRSIPTVEVGQLVGTWDAGDETFGSVYNDLCLADYEAYLQKLTASGYAIAETYALADNAYALLTSKDTTLYVSYLPMIAQMRVYAEQAGTALYPTEKEATQGGEAKPLFWMLQSDYKGSGHNGGSSFVMRLTDGTYVLEDGGYNTDWEADQLYAALTEDTPEGEKPVIVMWFITHLHSDHYGCLLNFAKRYGDKVEVKAFGYNIPINGFCAKFAHILPRIQEAMNTWEDAVQYSKLHSGMTIGFADAKATVICTHEDTYPREQRDLNDTSLVIRMDFGGQRMMYLADACSAESRAMSETIPVSELQSDFVQVAHHSYEGCLQDLYEKINAKVGLWTMSIYGYKLDTVENVFEHWMKKTSDHPKFPYANAYLIQESSIEKFFVDGAGSIKLELPYTVSGDRLPDYQAIFEQIKTIAPREVNVT